MPKKPEWAPEGADKAFTTRINEGVEHPHAERKTQSNKKVLAASADYYIQGIKDGNTAILAQVITILESNSAKHYNLGQDILSAILPLSGNSIRIGITGAPGAGKSTFIDAFGSMLCKKGKKVAVLAIDPSSSLTRGSILGDKTRMENLSREKNSFIRPSPSGDNSGGVARKTRESILACEAAGYDVIIVETIGVGQSEITVRSMVDFFLLLLLPGEGDELQGIKKGTVELADAIVVNKSDGDNLSSAEYTKQQYTQAVHYIQQATRGWTTVVESISSINNTRIEEIWNIILDFEKLVKISGVFEERRNNQLLVWFHSTLRDMLIKELTNNSKIKNSISQLEKQLLAGSTSVSKATQEIINKILNR